MLASAFSKLPNLRTIGIRDYNGKGRWRDGDAAMWRSYGWSSVKKDPRHLRHAAMSPDPILSLLLYSLGETLTRPDRIEVFLRRDRLHDASFDLSPSFMQSRAILVLSNLRTLLLSLQPGEDPRPFRPDPVQKHEESFRNLKGFLQHTPLLEHLRLNFVDYTQPSWCTDTLLAWLGTMPGPGDDLASAPVTLDHLTTLDLGMAHVKPRTLLAIVSKFTKLEALSLWKIAFPKALEELNDPGFTGTCMWSYYLPKLGEAFPVPENIKNLMVGWPTERVTAGLLPERVRFADRTKVDARGSLPPESFDDVVVYRKEVGSDVCAWLGELGERASLPPAIESDSSQSDEGEGERSFSDTEEIDSEDEEAVARAIEAADQAEAEAIRIYGEEGILLPW